MADPDDILNRPKMYRIRPYFEIKKVKLPSCMYLLKPVHQLTNVAPSSSEASSSSLSYLEKRQEWVLSQISRLQEKVKSLAEDMGVGAADVGILQQEGSTQASSLRDVVISCPATGFPPYALRALYHCISGCVRASCKVYIHSSTSVTDDLRDFLNSLPSDPNPVLRVVIIWKSAAVCPKPSMVVSPQNQTPVEGVANISRYLCREYFPALYEDERGRAEVVSLMDSWMDLMTTTLERGSAKEKGSVLRRLNAQLGSAQFLVGDQPSVADIIGFCALCEHSGMKMPANVKQWLQRVQRSFPGLESVPCPYLNES